MMFTFSIKSLIGTAGVFFILFSQHALADALLDAKNKAEKSFREAETDNSTSSYEEALKNYNDYLELLQKDIAEKNDNLEDKAQKNDNLEDKAQKELPLAQSTITTIQSTLFQKQQEVNNIIDNQTCILTLGEICLASGIGVNADHHGDIDLRLVGILYNPSLGPDQSLGWHAYLSPAEGFIDAFGVGGSARWFKYKENKYTVMHLGVHVVVNNEENNGDWRFHYIISW